MLAARSECQWFSKSCDRCPVHCFDTCSSSETDKFESAVERFLVDVDLLLARSQLFVVAPTSLQSVIVESYGRTWPEFLHGSFL